MQSSCLGAMRGSCFGVNLDALLVLAAARTEHLGCKLVHPPAKVTAPTRC